MLYEFFLPFTYDLTSVYHFIEIFEKSTSPLVGNGRISEVTPERDLNDFHDIENTITKVCNSRVNRGGNPYVITKVGNTRVRGGSPCVITKVCNTRVK